MRRGLLKDLANTPTDMACGWRLGGDLEALVALAGSTVVIDLLNGSTSVDGEPTQQKFYIAGEVRGWLDERIKRDRVPEGTILAATLAITPSLTKRGVKVDCLTRLRAIDGIYESAESQGWEPGDEAAGAVFRASPE